MPATSADRRRSSALQKSPEAFRTISEVGELLDVPAHVLRFWESRFTQIKPIKRGGGRRYYRPGDIDLLRGIRDLLYQEGMTIKGVQKILREQGVRHVAGLGHVDLATLKDEAEAEAAQPVRPTLRIVRPDDVTPPDAQIDLFAHADAKLRRPFPPDPEMTARVDEIRMLTLKLARLRDRMAASAL